MFKNILKYLKFIYYYSRDLGLKYLKFIYYYSRDLGLKKIIFRKFILVGDPAQLPPVVQNHHARKLGNLLFYNLNFRFICFFDYIH